MIRKKIAYLSLVFFLVQAEVQSSERQGFFSDGGTDFSSLNQTDLIDAFGIGAATYGALGLATAEANGELFRQFANGSSMALGMVPVKRQVKERGGVTGKTPESHPAFAKAIRTAHKAGLMIMESELSTHRSRIMAMLSSNPNNFETQVEETILICRSNVDFQQQYIDLWRDLVAAGWITIE